MRILFCFSVAEEFFAKVATELQAMDPTIRLSGLALSRFEHRNVLESAARWDHVAVFSDVLRDRMPARPDLDYLREIEKRYGVPNLYLIAAGDWHVKDYPHERMLRMLDAAFHFLLELWDRVQPDMVIAEGIDCVSSYGLYAIARQKGVPFLWPASRTNNRVAFVRNPAERWERMEAILASLPDRPLDGARRRMAEDYIATFRAECQKPTYLRANRMPGLGLQSVRLFLNAIRTFEADRASYHMTPPWKLPFRRLRRMARRAYADARLFQQPDPNDEFTFFGLHYQPEASTLVWAPFYVDQPSLAERVAKSLPVGQWLYVKEHPFAVGRRPLSEYRRLRQIPQVKLISPYIDSHSLIPKAACVVTITGTVGWEAMMYEKPVVTFGRGFCSTTGLVRQVREIEELPAILREATSAWRPDWERLLKVVAAVLEGSYEGDIGYRDGVPEARSEANARLVARALLQECHEHASASSLRTSLA